MRLMPKIDTLVAVTNRGRYHYHEMQFLGASTWTVYFFQYGGGCIQICACEPLSDACAAAQSHANAQPDHPLVLAWPADMEAA